ncbi:MAG: hypothetical protein N4A57_06365 [Anaeromicrobium sp.]|jgi:hypothetical protein|uniref:hypothetical protein n=1 Tax=Anaeromicrobium sp. TaxID=1929132 RepID=UPI0025F8FCEE|nr:hypothetical protein [Anaeromicrobium sp.]MCT4593876.1 hypothetical protein [Anaeromicrobium sp.]
MDERCDKMLYDKENIQGEFTEYEGGLIKLENEKLMNYIATMRAEKKKKSFWNKIFSK